MKINQFILCWKGHICHHETSLFPDYEDFRSCPFNPNYFWNRNIWKRLGWLSFRQLQMLQKFRLLEAMLLLSSQMYFEFVVEMFSIRWISKRWTSRILHQSMGFWKTMFKKPSLPKRLEMSIVPTNQYQVWKTNEINFFVSMIRFFLGFVTLTSWTLKNCLNNIE